LDRDIIYDTTLCRGLIHVTNLT